MGVSAGFIPENQQISFITLQVIFRSAVQLQSHNIRAWHSSRQVHQFDHETWWNDLGNLGRAEKSSCQG